MDSNLSQRTTPSVNLTLTASSSQPKPLILRKRGAPSQSNVILQLPIPMPNSGSGSPRLLMVTAKHTQTRLSVESEMASGIRLLAAHPPHALIVTAPSAKKVGRCERQILYSFITNLSRKPSLLTKYCLLFTT